MVSRPVVVILIVQIRPGQVVVLIWITRCPRLRVAGSFFNSSESLAQVILTCYVRYHISTH
jgi:hypothetical protein